MSVNILKEETFAGVKVRVFLVSKSVQNFSGQQIREKNFSRLFLARKIREN